MLSIRLQPFLTHVNVRPSLERHRSRGFADFLDAKIIPDAIRMLTARRKVAPQVARALRDQASLPYLRWLRVSPAKELTPAFHPNVTEYRLDVPYDQLVLRVRARALYCHAEARLDDRLGPARPINYTLGLGYNRVSVVVVDIRHPEARVANAYVLTVFRRPEISDGIRRFDADRSYAACNLKQSCELRIYPREPCGLQREAQARTWASMLRQAEELKICHSGHESGRWVLPCENCNIAKTCFWNEARWMPVNCRYADIANLPLQDCLAGKKLLFVGDSTNRGMMYYVLMRLNGTLGEWHKSHGILLHRRNLNGGRTDAGFAYYPQFWLPTNRRPPLGATLRQLVNGMTPLENSAKTVLVVGGVHWIGVKHLTSLAATLRSLNLGNVKVIVKTFGSGFHQKADGVHQVAMKDLQNMGNTNRDLIRRAKQLRMDVVDTYNMTSARFKDFMQGNCACHFHR
ncbi:conserved hypothetical protein, partial [Ixodes scapularis]